MRSTTSILFCVMTMAREEVTASGGEALLVYRLPEMDEAPCSIGTGAGTAAALGCR
jgi:hypothetical protein